MMRHAGFLAALLLTAACQQDQAPEPPAPTAAAKYIYDCADGTTVTAWYPTTDTARLRLRDQTIEMKIAISASGARYVSDRWQWWTKGPDQAWLAPLAPGEEIASAPGLTCTGRP